MNLNEALGISQDVSRIKRLAGVNAIYPYKETQFADAVECLHGHLTASKAEADALRDKIAKLEAQLRASNARSAKGRGDG